MSIFPDDSSSLKPNQIKVILDCKCEHISKAVKYFCVNNMNNDERNRYNQVGIKQKFKNRERKLLTAPILTSGINYYYFDNTKLEINVRKYTKPLAIEHKSLFHEEMDITTCENNATYEENKELIDKFFKEASIYFSEKWLDKEEEENKVTVFIWDEYWETLEKSLSRSLSTIYLDGKEKEIYDKIVNFRSKETEQLYKEFGIPYKLNCLFHGVPGTGKTSLIFALASELKMNVAIMTFTKDMNDTVLMRCFRRLPDNSILIIEDIDTLFESRKKNDEFANNITFSGLLNTTDGIAHVDKQIIIMTTNHPLTLDPALKRPGRIDLTLEFKYSSKKQISTMFKKFIPKQADKFKDFYSKIKHLKITSAMLQHFLFSNRLCDDILEHIEELEKISNDNQYEPKKSLYS